MCRNYREFPEFSGLSSSQIRQMIDAARLSSADREIAKMRLVDCCDYADIGAAVCMDRSAVSKRLRRIIIPRILENAGQ